MCFSVLLPGFLIGYAVSQKKEQAPVCAASVSTADTTYTHETGAAPLMDWDDVKRLFVQKLTPAKLEKTFRLLENLSSPPPKST